MPVTNYYTIDGVMIAEETGGVRTDYLTDALGSVTATVDSSGNILNTYRYKPYGEQLAKTGTSSDPKFTWVGSLGYRQTGRKYSDTYVRARHYGTEQGRWTSRDKIERYFTSEYRYALSSPVSNNDPSGLVVQQHMDCPGKNVCIEQLPKPRPCKHKLHSPTQPPCQKSGQFPGNPLPDNLWQCIHDGVKQHCSKRPFDESTLMGAIRCIIYGESEDGRNDPKGAPYGMMQIFEKPWGEVCSKLGYPNWKTNACENIKCGTYILCSCLGSRNESFSKCGFKSGKNAQFQTIEDPNSGLWCSCMVGCGFHCPKKKRQGSTFHEAE